VAECQREALLLGAAEDKAKDVQRIFLVEPLDMASEVQRISRQHEEERSKLDLCLQVCYASRRFQQRKRLTEDFCL
jgi:hypothetical protein